MASTPSQTCAPYAAKRDAETSPAERRIYGVRGEFPAAQRQQDAGRKHGVQETEGVARQDQPVGCAVARAVGIFSSDAIGSELLAGRQVLFDPGVFLDFAVKDRRQVAGIFV
jgi:hypothetical protein